jgi:hypothetical protein
MSIVKCTHCGAENEAGSKYCSSCGHELLKTEDEIAVKQPARETKQNPKPKLLSLIVSIVVFGLSYAAVQQIFFKKPSFDKVMMAAASEINKTCPIMVDKDTRFDNAVALANNTFQYNYSLLGFDKSRINTDSLQKFMSVKLINGIKTNPQMRIYRDNKTTFVYNYNDTDGKFIMKVLITPDMYQ